MTNSSHELQGVSLLRLPRVLEVFPVSRAGWYAGVASGRYPQPVQLGARAVAWRSQDIRALIDSL